MIRKISRRFTALILVLALTVGCAVLSAEAQTVGEVTGTKVRVRSKPGTDASCEVLGQLDKPAQVTILGTATDSGGNLWYQIQSGSLTGYMTAEFVRIISAPKDLTFEEQLAAFPESYRDSLRALHATYSNWVFTPDFLSVTLEEAVAAEHTPYNRKLVSTSDAVSWRNCGEGAYVWSENRWIQASGSWVSASKEVIAYYMEPRNFLNGNDIYMFAQQSYDANVQTRAGVEKITAGTFLAEPYTDPNDSYTSYTDVIMEAAKQSGVSPYVIASLLIIEQGTKGTSALISGAAYTAKSGTTYSGVYNFFNFSASGDDVVGNGLKFATEQGWTTRSKAIIGGAKRTGNDYIGKGQDTYYYMDYNVRPSGYSIYTHQYAQAVYDQKSKGAKLRSYYLNNPNAALSFSIPVYKNPSAVPAAKPAETSARNNYYFTGISVSGLSPAFTMYRQNYSLSVSKDTSVALTWPEGASYAGQPYYDLKAGSNTVTLSVKAETGYTNDYILTVNASKACRLTLTGNGIVQPENPPDVPPKTVVCGDTNHDDVVDIVDLANVQKHLLHLIVLEGDDYTGADTDHDREITIIDLANIQKHLLRIKILS